MKKHQAPSIRMISGAYFYYDACRCLEAVFLVQIKVRKKQPSKISAPNVKGIFICQSNKVPARAGPIIFPKLMYALFIPAAYPCSLPAVFEINVLTAGRIKVVAVAKMVATNKIM